jgi:hypothetical protein
MFCREHVVQLHHQIDEIRSRGAELVVIGSGAPNFVRGFRDTTHFEGPIYCDPELRSYQAANLRRSWAANLAPAVIARGVRALVRGHMQGRTQGDGAQQGGAAVILPPGRVAYSHRSEGPGDNAAPEAILAALDKAIQKRPAQA